MSANQTPHSERRGLNTAKRTVPKAARTCICAALCDVSSLLLPFDSCVILDHTAARTASPRCLASAAARPASQLRVCSGSDDIEADATAAVSPAPRAGDPGNVLPVSFHRCICWDPFAYLLTPCFTKFYSSLVPGTSWCVVLPSYRALFALPCAFFPGYLCEDDFCRYPGKWKGSMILRGRRKNVQGTRHFL